MSRLNIRKLFIVAVTSTLGSVILNLTISTMNSNVNIGLFQTKDVRENTVLYDQEQNNSEYINHENILDEFINHQINKSKKMGHSETDLVIAEDSTFLKGKTLTVLDSMRDVNGSDTAVTNTLQDSFSQDFTTKSRNDLADLPKDKSHITTISEPLQEQSNEQLEAFNVSLKHTDDPRDGETEQIYLQLQQREQLESEDTQLHQREQLESEDTQLHQREQLESEDTQLHQREKLESENTQLHQREQLESEDTQLHQREQLESEDTQLHQREQLESEDTQLHQRAQLESEDTQLHQREQLESEDTQLHQREELESENTQLHQREELESEDTQLHQREELESENTQLHQREQLESENTQLHQREELESEDTQLHQREELESENTQLHQREELESEDKQIQQREELESDNDQIEQNPQQVEQMVDEEIEGVADYLTSNNLSDTSLENVMKTAPGPVGVSLTTTPTLNYCPDKSSHLIGHLAGLLRETTREELIDYFPEMDNGGRLRPTDCAARQRLAVIFPYRNRYQHLHVVLHNLLPILKRQQVDVTFFVIEQSALSTFNRGALQNIGFLEAQKLSSFDCYIFHDVDLIPLNDNNLYRCESNPRHFAVALNKFNYRLLHSNYFGGVVGFSREQYLKVNGNSNLYFGWGGEDDDLRIRLYNKHFKLLRYSPDIARYHMIKHTRDIGNELNPLRYSLLKNAAARQDIEGLNTVKYRIVNITFDRLYTWITVEINTSEILKTTPALTQKDIDQDSRKWRKRKPPSQKIPLEQISKS